MFELDVLLFDRLTSWRAPWLDTAMAAFSHVGGFGFVWLVMAVVAAFSPARRAAAFRLVLAIGLTFLVVDAVLKPAIGRDRPFQVLTGVQVIDTRPVTHSLPSGHAASAFAGALAASQIWPAARLPLFALASAIALSRVYVGVHFPFDVFAGAITGLACAWLVLGGRRPPPASWG
ncbi:MAG: phosphatase PAP2 family protein [Vicinamibacterales bacterium]|nr:phosphatase PAP2 family protein [Vicinamibacterales bacterium]